MLQSQAPLKVLLIEDTEERQQILTSLYRSHAWVLVNTGKRAIILLEAYDFDIISIDYNLRGELNGVDVAQCLRYSRNQNARIIIHSILKESNLYWQSSLMLSLIPYQRLLVLIKGLNILEVKLMN
ncbi:hypothetical protein A6770_40245 [Nostoc minutum NIES-26]|uniref:Response regulatory domain-containing protein n=1 Tax=Nostoc minutum NIES-26 TaxID=1844469 RepID=A0A367RNZ6_9NOSO|nr:hypothetical protein A6770_40245 [Nostoc minutum NIES-26]